MIAKSTMHTRVLRCCLQDPPSQANVAGWAMCLQYDQWGRCTVGRFNWVATTITGNPAVALAPNVMTSERSTALHEVMHVLGLKGQHSGMGEARSLFRDENGCTRPDKYLFEDAQQSEGNKEEGFITKQVRHWKTPLVCTIPLVVVKGNHARLVVLYMIWPDLLKFGVASRQYFFLFFFASSSNPYRSKLRSNYSPAGSRNCAETIRL